MIEQHGELKLLPRKRLRASAARTGAVDVIATCALPRSPYDPNTAGKQLMSWTVLDAADKRNPPLVSDSTCFFSLLLHPSRVTFSGYVFRMRLRLGAAAR